MSKIGQSVVMWPSSSYVFPATLPQVLIEMCGLDVSHLDDYGFCHNCWDNSHPGVLAAVSDATRVGEFALALVELAIIIAILSQHILCISVYTPFLWAIPYPYIDHLGLQDQCQYDL